MVMSLWPRFLAHPLCTIRRIDTEEHRIRIFEQAVRERQRERSLFTMSEHNKYIYKLDNGKKVKVKFSHTRYPALGPELIPVYRQSARR